LEVAHSRSGFAQTFVLNEHDDRLYIVSDVSTIIDRKALGKEGDAFQVPNEFPLSNKRAQRPGPKADIPRPAPSPPAPRVDDPPPPPPPPQPVQPPVPVQPPAPAQPPAQPPAPAQQQPPPPKGNKPESGGRRRQRGRRSRGGWQPEQGDDQWYWPGHK
jgi:hypothetical protein